MDEISTKIFAILEMVQNIKIEPKLSFCQDLFFLLECKYDWAHYLETTRQRLCNDLSEAKVH